MQFLKRQIESRNFSAPGSSVKADGEICWGKITTRIITANHEP